MLSRALAYHKIGIIACAFAFFLAETACAQAATLSLVPVSGAAEVGNVFSVSIQVSSTDQSMNAASGVLNFPIDTLQVVSLSKSNSIMNLWVQEPTYSNVDGTVHFEGIVLNPGFTGTGGTILTIKFKAIAQGVAPLSLSGSQVLANDGQGTNILKETSGATITVSQPIAAPAPTQIPASKRTEKAEPTTATTIATTTALEPPMITGFSQSVSLGSTAKIEGASMYPGAEAILTLQGPGTPLELTTIIADDGRFIFTLQHTLIPGDYTGTVLIKKGDLTSPPSTVFIITFQGTSFLGLFAEYLFQPTVLIALAAVFGFLLGVLFIYMLHGKRRRNRSVHEIAREIDVDVHQAFIELRNRINRALHDLEKESVKRELTAAELRFVREMTGTIKDTEKLIDKEIHDADT
jgi:hypothetical protein